MVFAITIVGVKGIGVSLVVLVGRRNSQTVAPTFVAPASDSKSKPGGWSKSPHSGYYTSHAERADGRLRIGRMRVGLHAFDLYAINHQFYHQRRCSSDLMRSVSSPGLSEAAGDFAATKVGKAFLEDSQCIAHRAGDNGANERFSNT
jgi:hypothetical protein